MVTTNIIYASLCGILLGVVYSFMLWSFVKNLAPGQKHATQMVTGFFARLMLLGITFFAMIKLFTLQGLIACVITFFITKEITVRIIKAKHIKGKR